ncbi:unnamed protein product, partial [Rotaria magnacalcarata]
CWAFNGEGRVGDSSRSEAGDPDRSCAI